MTKTDSEKSLETHYDSEKKNLNPIALFLGVFILIIGAGLVGYYGFQNKTEEFIEETNEIVADTKIVLDEELEKNGIRLDSIEPGDIVSETLTIQGEITNKIFAGKDMVALVMDETGNMIGVSKVSALENEENGTYTIDGTINIENTNSSEGVLLIEEFVESNGEVNFKSHSIPIKFE